MGKTRELFKKTGYIKRTFHARMDTTRDRSSTGLTEAEEIKTRRQEYTEELYRKGLNDPDNHDGVITHLEPDILGCEVKRGLGSITTNKASGGEGIPSERFQILKGDAVKCYTSDRSQAHDVPHWLRFLEFPGLRHRSHTPCPSSGIGRFPAEPWDFTGQSLNPRSGCEALSLGSMVLFSQLKCTRNSSCLVY